MKMTKSLFIELVEQLDDVDHVLKIKRYTW
jgi:hypothetical protein